MDREFGSYVLDIASRMMIPFISLFALYVVTHGHYGPGGGFQAGTLLAFSIILMRLIHGQKTHWKLSINQAVILFCVGVLIYAGLGVAPLVADANILDFGVLPFGHEEHEVRALATLGVEIGVTLAVMGVFVAIYESLVREED